MICLSMIDMCKIQCKILALSGILHVALLLCFNALAGLPCRASPAGRACCRQRLIRETGLIRRRIRSTHEIRVEGRPRLPMWPVLTGDCYSNTSTVAPMTACYGNTPTQRTVSPRKWQSLQPVLRDHPVADHSVVQ